MQRVLFLICNQTVTRIKTVFSYYELENSTKDANKEASLVCTLSECIQFNSRYYFPKRKQKAVYSFVYANIMDRWKTICYSSVFSCMCEKRQERDVQRWCKETVYQMMVVVFSLSSYLPLTLFFSRSLVICLSSFFELPNFLSLLLSYSRFDHDSKEELLRMLVRIQRPLKSVWM